MKKYIFLLSTLVLVGCGDISTKVATPEMIYRADQECALHNGTKYVFAVGKEYYVEGRDVDLKSETIIKIKCNDGSYLETPFVFIMRTQ